MELGLACETKLAFSLAISPPSVLLVEASTPARCIAVYQWGWGESSWPQRQGGGERWWEAQEAHEDTASRGRLHHGHWSQKEWKDYQNLEWPEWKALKWCESLKRERMGVGWKHTFKAFCLVTEPAFLKMPSLVEWLSKKRTASTKNLIPKFVYIKTHADTCTH